MNALHVVGRWFAWTALLFAGYAVITDHPTLDETIAGATIAAIAAIAACRLYAVAEVRYGSRWPDVLRLAGVPLNVLQDAFVVGGAIVRSIVDRDALKGSMETVPFRFGETHDKQEAVRRALVTYGICAAPNSLVCAMEEGTLFVHRLSPRGSAPRPDDPEWPL